MKILREAALSMRKNWWANRSRVKLLPHVDFLGGCIDSKCAKMGAKSLSNPEIEGCVSATQGSSFCSFVVLHHFVENVHDNQVIQAVAFFYPQALGWSRFHHP